MTDYSYNENDYISICYPKEDKRQQQKPDKIEESDYKCGHEYCIRDDYLFCNLLGVKVKIEIDDIVERQTPTIRIDNAKVPYGRTKGLVTKKDGIIYYRKWKSHYIRDKQEKVKVDICFHRRFMRTKRATN